MGLTPFRVVEGVAAPLLLDHIDTDQIIPSREMRTVSRDGLGEGLFAGWRYTQAGGRELNPDFVLNKPGYAGVSILLAGVNFGCGSSREHAVWALAEFGVRAIIAQSFGEIFYNNCVRNGVLPVVLDADAIIALAAHVAQVPQAHTVVVDLPGQTVRAQGLPDFSETFSIGAFDKRLLLEGLDPIALTLQSDAAITAFLDRDQRARPWLYANGAG